MARTALSGYVQKALLYYMLELGQATLVNLVAQARVSRNGANAVMQRLVRLGLCTRAVACPETRPANRPSYIYGITTKGVEAALVMDFEPSEKYPQGPYLLTL